MADNAQKTPIATYLDMKIAHDIASQMRNRSGRLPATLHQVKDGDKTNTIWMVNFETDGTYTLPMVAMPVHTNEYTRPPYKQGDKGFVSTADVDTTSMSGLNDNGTPANYGRPANLAALVWHPLGNMQFTPVIDPTAHEQYGGPGGTITHDGSKKSFVRTHPTNGTTTSAGGDGSGADGPHTVTTSTSGVAVATTAAHTIQAQNAQLDQSGNLTAKQNITSTSGNISAPAGQVSGQTGSFPGGGFMGGLSLLSGLLSGGGSPGSPAVSVDSNAGAISANTLAAKQYALLPSYTVTQLLAALPPTTTSAGARVFVTDLTTGTFAAVISGSGGGALGRCAFCDGTNWRVG